MDHIVFKDRNRSYGAFRLRRSYPRVLSLCVLLTAAAFAALFVILFFLLQRSNGEKTEMWYFFDLSNAGLSHVPYRQSEPPPSGGMKIPTLEPIPSDSIAVTDTLRNPADGDGDDTTGQGNGNGNNSGDGQIYYSAQQPPSFPGGDGARTRFLQQNINYPPDALKKKIKGAVYVAFIVEKDGSITHVKLLKGIGYGCDEEALRVVNSMPRWTPGRQNGIPVRVQMALPLMFSLN
jgi:protein TonB